MSFGEENQMFYTKDRWGFFKNNYIVLIYFILMIKSKRTLCVKQTIKK